MFLLQAARTSVIMCLLTIAGVLNASVSNPFVMPRLSFPRLHHSRSRICQTGEPFVPQPLLKEDICHILVIDFDEADRGEDFQAFVQSCAKPGVSAAIKVSRSGNGAHVWVFSLAGFHTVQSSSSNGWWH
jgi:hypothetical protein